jgi:hypothetical protein
MSKILIIILAAACVLAFQPQLRAQSGYEDTAPAAAKTTTVKSSKSNSSDRKGNPSAGPAKATNLNSSRSNRKRTSAGGSAARATTVKSSKSNTSD